MKKFFALFSTCLLVFLTLVGCSSSKPTQGGAEGAKKPDRITIATATTGGVYYPLGNAMAKLWTEKSGVQAVAQTTSGGVANINILKKKEAEIAFVENGIVYFAQNGTEMFQGKKTENLRGLTYLYPNVIQFVVKADSNINSIKDLKGKRFVPGSVGSSTEANSRIILGAYGLDYRDRKDVTVDYMGFTEAAEALKNGQIDAFAVSGGIPTASIMDVATSANIKLLSIDQDVIAKIKKDYPFYDEYSVPKGTYKNQQQDVKTVSVANLLVVREDLPADFVYNLTKSMYENLPQLVATHKAIKDLKKEDALKGMIIPLHEGAKKYYKEIGLNVDGK
ncbi:TAXI family TRAP transporter solute-binding subunit [Aneurinibacillus uraniidurans]|uniref:TAXI family TRAP transporter solute-binding subunit n=1 Tax=Aneurinibacillus uraniidurans TaxID=2966586 RepID=UPI002349565A|nr:TAXI family TRAP transporter solute-binding subunit [Aneurinibacillus sp. B1]WCN38899.1 TAXI family TRAP transporter solute-binding subunit [Aneurinibacillus sp. B1]